MVRNYVGFELRWYPAHVVAEVSVDQPFEQAGNTAFGYLFYITGQNRSKSSIAMTSPVVQSNAGAQKVAMTAPVVQHSAREGGHVVAFVLPSSMTQETAPEPTDPRVSIRTVPASLAAVMRYSGRWTLDSYERHCQGLLTAMEVAGLKPLGTPLRPAVQAVVPASQRSTGRRGRECRAAGSLARENQTALCLTGAMDGDSRITRDEYEAVLAARNDLGKEMEPALVDSFVEKVEHAIAVRQSGENFVSERADRRRSAEANRAMVVAIVTAGVGIPLTGIALGTGSGLPALLVIWIGLVMINIAVAIGRRGERG